MSGALSFFLLIYLFLPYIFKFLVHSFPLLACSVALVRIFWSSEDSKIKNVKGDVKKREGISPNKFEFVVDRNDSQTSKRQNVEEKNKEWEGEVSMEETNMGSPNTCNNASTNRTIPIEENKLVIEEKKESTASGHGQSSSDNRLATEKIQIPDMDRRLGLKSEPSMSDLVLSYGLDEFKDKFDGDGGFESESDNSEDEAQNQDGNKAVKWSEDDQQNLMDLGISEIERNKRLETLIARRRERKLLKIQVQNGLIDLKNVPPSQIAPLLIARTNPFDVPDGSEEIEGLHIPGSAPSMLGPARSPFDIPYEPSEEKPNLMGDSCHEEFMEAHQKEMLCRHESFTLGPFFPFEPQLDQGDTEFNPFFVTGRKATYRLGYSRYRRMADKGNHDWLIEQLLYKEGDPVSCVESGSKPVNDEGRKTNNMTDTKGEGSESAHGLKSLTDHIIDVNREPQLIKDNNHESSSSSLTAGNDPSNVKRVAVSEHLELGVSNAEKSFMGCSIPKSITIQQPSYSFSPYAVDKSRMFYTGKGPLHTLTQSLASDLQVVVSEIGSPTLTVDGTNSPTDVEYMTYDGDIDKEISSACEEIGGASSHLSGDEANDESKSVKEHEANEDDLVGVGLSVVNKKLKEITSSMPLQQINEEDSDYLSLLSSSRSNISSELQNDAINFDHNINDEAKKVITEIGEPRPSNSSPEVQLSENSMGSPPHKAESEKPKEWSNPSENLTKELQAVIDLTDPQAHANNKVENLETSEHHIAPTVQQEFGVGEVSINSSSSSSPNSALIEYASISQVLPSDFEQRIHLYVPQSDLENTTKSNLNDEGPVDNMALLKHQLLIDDVIVQQSNGDSENFQELTSYARNSIEGADIVCNANNPVVSGKEDKEKAKSDEEYEGQSQSLNEHEAVEPQGLAEERTLEVFDEKSGKMVDNEAPIGLSKPTKENCHIRA
ncbi:Ulp1 protease family C-terminal catalytic domain containing protein expressed [Quillaja saponaria]|uniref:Ulp1 protease family C-terminal catalytic domain containing protein expressed n=1 Tax=Quillaja saponaria TaxID=32244 RepID=A0AAD7PQT9_QUISA|nr:Ulp1 protease family C-terminal catalytic domain containing protein expressed [Quillaja saponaria]